MSAVKKNEFVRPPFAPPCDTVSAVGEKLAAHVGDAIDNNPDSAAAAADVMPGALEDELGAVG